MWKKRPKKTENAKFTSKYKTSDTYISTSLEANSDILTSEYFENDDDLILIPVGKLFSVAYIETIVDDKKLKEILDYLSVASNQEAATQSIPDQLPFRYKNETHFQSIVQSLTRGSLVLFVENSKEAFIMDIQAIKERALSEPVAEATIKGPREGFNESFKTNISLIRKRIQHHKLKIEKLKIGSISRTDIAVLYLDGVANDDTVSEVKKRLNQIEVDAVQSSNQIQSFIKDHSFSIMPLIGSSERPDKIAANILEGRIAIIVDGTPFVLYGPISIFSLLQAPDDYYDSTYIASLLRMVRLTAVFVSLLLPSIYIALTTFHHEMIPTALALSIAAGRESIPFPALIETLFIEITFEFLREAGLRLPKAIGNTISIVGALVIGDAAVRAGFVSPLVVIIVAITAISSFIIPNYSLGVAFRILRFVFIFLSATFGFFGIVWGLMVLFLYLVSLRSLGYPYLAPHSPLLPGGLRDTVFRFPLFRQSQYPKFTVDDPSLKKFPFKENPGENYRKKDDKR